MNQFSPDQLEVILAQLAASGLPQERHDFWRHKFEAGVLTDDEGEVFVKEVTDHIAGLDKKIDDAGAQVISAHVKMDEARMDVLPEVQRKARALQKDAAELTSNMKREVGEIEKELEQGVEEIREGEEKMEIEALKEKLQGEG